MGLQKRLNALGRKIRALRIEYDLTQEDLAEKVNMSREHISCVERGKHPINILNLYKIADAFEIDIKELL